jgi:hypothetical protein
MNFLIIVPLKIGTSNQYNLINYNNYKYIETYISKLIQMEVDLFFSFQNSSGYRSSNNIRSYSTYYLCESSKSECLS